MSNGRSTVVQRYLISLGSLAALTAVWAIVARVGQYPAFILPTPLDVAERFVEYSASGRLWPHVGATILEVLLGFSLSLVVASVLGYALAHSPSLERAVLPLLVTAQALPIVAVAPLVILWLNFGLAAKVFVCALISFFPMLVSTVVALRNIDPRLIEVARIFGANRWQMLTMVEVPLALRVFLGGIKVGLPLSVTGAVVGEFVAADQGLGYLINLGRGLFDTPLMFVALFILATIALVLYESVVVLEHLTTDQSA